MKLYLAQTRCTLREICPFSVTSEPVWCDPDKPVEAIWSEDMLRGNRLVGISPGGLLLHRTLLDRAFVHIPSFRSDGVEASLEYACLVATGLQLTFGTSYLDTTVGWTTIDWSVSARGLVGSVPISGDMSPGMALRCFLRGGAARVEVRVVLLGLCFQPVQ